MKKRPIPKHRHQIKTQNRQLVTLPGIRNQPRYIIVNFSISHFEQRTWHCISRPAFEDLMPFVNLRCTHSPCKLHATVHLKSITSLLFYLSFFWICFGIVLSLFWYCSGVLQVIYWYCFAVGLVRTWSYTNLVLACFCTAFAQSKQNQKRVGNWSGAVQEKDQKKYTTSSKEW